MSNRLEQYVRDHREEFDGEEPDNKIWEAIRKDVGLAEDPNKKKPALVVRLSWATWAVAAAVVLLIAGTVWFIDTRQTSGNPAVATAAGPKTTQPATRPDTQAATAGQNPALNPAQTRDSSPNNDNLANNSGKDAGAQSDLDESQNEEMYHYAKLVEIKQKELKTIEKDEPLLYQQFSMDVNKLDSAYHSLQNQLPKNPNREQILEAMLQNLQLQMGLLNHQLDIIKQINHSKKTEYEKAYKTT
jgi:hypothetical protein